MGIVKKRPLVFHARSLCCPAALFAPTILYGLMVVMKLGIINESKKKWSSTGLFKTEASTVSVSKTG